MNLLKYFTSRNEDLPASYVKKCKKFLEEITKKNKSSSSQAGGPAHKKNKAASVFPKGKINWFKKKMDRDQA